jgi:hypothetical protein
MAKRRLQHSISSCHQEEAISQPPMCLTELDIGGQSVEVGSLYSQCDEQEQGAQVASMLKICRQAAQVVSWLDVPHDVCDPGSANGHQSRDIAT